MGSDDVPLLMDWMLDRGTRKETGSGLNQGSFELQVHNNPTFRQYSIYSVPILQQTQFIQRNIHWWVAPNNAPNGCRRSKKTKKYSMPDLNRRPSAC